MVSLIPNYKKKRIEPYIEVGNGFDRAHGMLTSYEHFHQWLLGNGHKSFVRDFENLYQNIKEGCDCWCDLESALGKISLKQEWSLINTTKSVQMR